MKLHTVGMTHVKTAITLPEDLFERITARASEQGRSRSSVIADAIDAYIKSLEDHEFTRRMNEFFVERGEDDSDDLDARWNRRVARKVFERLNEQDGGWTK